MNTKKCNEYWAREEAGAGPYLGLSPLFSFYLPLYVFQSWLESWLKRTVRVEKLLWKYIFQQLQVFKNSSLSWKVSENLKSFRKSEKFLKIWKVSKNLKSFQKSEKFPKIWKWTGHVSLSLWSHVSRVASLSECSLVVFFNSGSDSVSQSVTREPIELSGDS